jgi:hypothetical protein
MLLNDPAAALPGAESSVQTSPNPGTLMRIPARAAGQLDGSAAEDWAADSGITMPKFQRAYFEQCVAA